MRLIIEFDGVLTDLRAVYYAAHRAAAEALGWSKLDEATFWQTTRSKGRQGVYLRGARPGLSEKYHPTFDARLERDDAIVALTMAKDTSATVHLLKQHGTCVGVTLGSNVAARRAWLERQELVAAFEEFHGLNADSRRRPAELIALAAGDRRTIVVAAGDTLLRAAAQTDLLKVAVSTGACSLRRLHQAGADVIYADLAELAESLDSGASDLIHAGLLPDVGRTI